MNTHEYDGIHNVERWHFYYVSLRRLVYYTLARYIPTKTRRAILDAGCGTGHLAGLLHRFGKVVGLDMHAKALQYSKRRYKRIVRASIEDMPFRREAFDVVVSLDVLYHRAVRSDREALHEFFRVLVPGGICILRLPAYAWLKSDHDVYVHGARRYEKNSVISTVRTAGFETCWVSYVGSHLIIPASIKAIMHHVSPGSGSNIDSIHPIMNVILILLGWIDAWIGMHVGLPIGNGIVIVCKKPLGKV